MTRSPLIQMRLYPEDFAVEVEQRATAAGISERVRRDLIRYYAALQRARIDAAFTPQEALFIVKHLRNRETITVREAKLLRYDLAKAVEDDRPEYVTKEAFLKKIASLNLLDWLGIVDAVERYVLAAQREHEIPEKLVRLVGLTRD